MSDLLIAVSEAANDGGVALGIFLDEVQYLSPEELAALVVACGLHPNFPPVISRVRRLFRPLLGRVVCGFGLIFIPVFPAALHSLRAVEKLSGFGSEAGVHCTAPASSWAGQAVRALAELP